VNLTLHLTRSCNMDCTYCTQEKTAVHMSRAVLHAACELAFSEGIGAGFCFFGGEPLLCEDLIFEAMDFCKLRSEQTGKPVCYKMTTNGTLLSDRMLERAVREHMEIGLSFDGLGQDICRRYRDGRGTRTDVESAAKRLLAVMPDTSAMMTAAPQAVPVLADSVRYLYALGFRRIHLVPAYGRRVTWDASALDALKAQMTEAAAFYADRLKRGDPFYFSPVESKIRNLLNGVKCSDRCHLGVSQMPVAPDGSIYACNQMIGDAEYCLGDVFSGISHEKCAALAAKKMMPAQCWSCPLSHRCLHSCGCLNLLETGSVSEVSAMQCGYEKMLIHLADATAADLYETARSQFDRYFRRNWDA